MLKFFVHKGSHISPFLYGLVCGKWGVYEIIHITPFCICPKPLPNFPAFGHILVGKTMFLTTSFAEFCDWYYFSCHVIYSFS